LIRAKRVRVGRIIGRVLEVGGKAEAEDLKGG
jgi:hypothetical protein